jgi:signal transduction histidine kinase
MLHHHESSNPTPSRREPVFGGDLPTRVLHGLARDLAAPVWALGVRSSALRRPAKLSAREKELLDFMGVQAQRIARVLAGAFDFLYVDGQGELPIDPRPCTMEDVCEAAIEELRETGFSGTISYEAEGDGAGEWDPGRLAQAISYLVELAGEIGSTPDPIVLRWRGDDDEVVVRVEAGRGGIPSGIDPEWGDEYEGDGGGLKAFLAHRIAVAHGGVLARFSANGSASFAMILPRMTPEDTQPETQH